jgi:hypothetical protein
VPADIHQLLSTEFPPERYPEMPRELEIAEGNLFEELGGFAQLMQRAIKRSDWETYARGAQLADRIYRNAYGSLLNAFAVGFLEHLDFNGPRGPKAWSLLTPDLQKLWHSVVASIDREHKKT